MNKTYWGWYKCIVDDANDEIIEFEDKIKIEIRS